MSAGALPAAGSSLLGEFKAGGPLQLGQDITILLVLRNLAPAAESLTAKMTVWTIMYTGKTVHRLLKDSLPVALGPGEEKRIPITIPYAEYKQHLTSDNMIQATALCRGAAGRLTLVKGVFALDSPPILIKVLGRAKVGQVARVQVTLTNPLDEDLHGCKLRAEGSDLTEETVEIPLPPVKARDCARVHLDLVPRRSGTRHLVVSFSSDKMPPINAFEAITVDE